MSKRESDLAAALVKLEGRDTLTVIGRCPEKRCRHRVRLEVEAITEVPAGSGGMTYEHAKHPHTADMVEWVGTASWLRNEAASAHACPEHGYNVEWAGLRAVHVGNVVCDESCRTAVSIDCRCSCGGTEHGTI